MIIHIILFYFKNTTLMLQRGGRVFLINTCRLVYHSGAMYMQSFLMMQV